MSAKGNGPLWLISISIRNKEMLIRSAKPEDAGRLLEIYKYYVDNTAISFDYEAPSVEEFRNRIVQTLERYPYFVVEDDGAVAPETTSPASSNFWSPLVAELQMPVQTWHRTDGSARGRPDVPTSSVALLSA